FVDQRAQHLALRLQFNQRELDRLVRGQRPAERLALPGISDRLVDAVLGGSEAGSGLPDPGLVEEVLHYLQSAPLAAEDRAVRYPDLPPGDGRVIGRHIERPEMLLDRESG